MSYCEHEWSIGTPSMLGGSRAVKRSFNQTVQCKPRLCRKCGGMDTEAMRKALRDGKMSRNEYERIVQRIASAE